MTNPQGTAWETEIVRRAAEAGIPVPRRLVKQGQKDEADVLLPGMAPEWHVPAVVWKRIIKTNKQTRQPLGERYVMILPLDEALDMLALMATENISPNVWVQAKWAEQISVTKVLGGLRRWLTAKLAS
jgi:hypothetical protein